MTKPVVQLHTIEQWFREPPEIRQLILQNIKVKEKVWKHLQESTKRPALTEPIWVPCKDCEQRGWIAVHPRYPGVHPSQVVGPCMLKLYNDIIGVIGERKIEPRLQLIFDIGHAVHHMFQGYGLKGAWGSYYKPEAPISGDFQELAEELMIEGHADADTLMMVDVPNSPVLYEVGVVHEYKTINSKNFAKLTRPKPEHQMQALIYSACLNRPVVAYLYLNKDDSNLADFPVEFKPDIWALVEAKIRMMVDFYNRQEAPRGEAGYHCQDCPYVTTCQTYKEDMLRKRG